VYSSPLERAMETAGPVGQRHHLEVQTALGLNEVDFGEWTGRTLAEGSTASAAAAQFREARPWRKCSVARFGSSTAYGSAIRTRELSWPS
jgi:broad specificity phosphatase PhoE